MKRFRLATRVAAIVVLSLTSLAQAGPVLERIRTSGQIVIGHRDTSVPFSYLDASKQPVGYAMELCYRIAAAVQRNLGLKTLNIAYKPVTSADRIAAIAEGKADLECGSTTNNAERREKVAFTIPHYIAGSRIAVRSDMTETSLDQFEGRKLVSTKGTTSLKNLQAQVQARSLKVQILEAADHAQALEMVRSRAADGFVMDDVLLYGLIASSARPDQLKVVGKFLTIEPLAIMLSKSDPALKRIVDDEMRRLIFSREAHALYERWFNQPIPPKNTPLNIPMNYLLRDFWKYPSDFVPT